MAPKKRKTKAAANPARGFATTSLPSRSKAVQSHQDDTIETNGDSSECRNDTIATELQPADTGTPLEKTSADFKTMTAEQFEAHLEDADLQDFIDTYSHRCKAEVERQVSKLEVERRQLRSQSYRLATSAWLDDELVDNVFEMKDGSTRAEPRLNTPETQGHGTNKDDLFRVWTLQRVLTALHLVSVNTAIEHVIQKSLHNELTTSQDYVWGLQDALEWYARNASRKDLPDYDNGNTPGLVKPSEELDSAEPLECVPAGQRVDRNDVHVISSNGESSSEDTENDMIILSETESEGDDDPSGFVEKYVRLRTSLFKTEQVCAQVSKKTKARLSSRVTRLNSRIQRLKNDVLFDVDLGEQAWQQSLRELQIEASYAKRSKPTKKGTSDFSKQSESSGTPASAMEDGSDLLGDMFAVAEDKEIDRTEEGQGTSNIRLANFGKWSGTQPRRLMEEICRTVLTSCKIRFSTLSTTSYSTRQKVDLTWSSSHRIEESSASAIPEEVICSVLSTGLTLEMRSIATATPEQSEAYLSTLAIFLLTSSNHADQKLSNRLPTVWRDLYSDLNLAHRLIIDAQHKLTLRELRSMIDRIEQDTEVNVDEIISSVPKKPEQQTPRFARSHAGGVPFTEDEATQQWADRAQSDSYAKMLDNRKKLPVYGYRDEILQSIEENRVLVICADTGAGKSTQIPSFILEHELSAGRDCRILVTQPRRISAISIARRVSQELGEKANDLGTERSLIGYAIRLESKTSQTTRVTFATTGVLLRMIESSPNLDDLDCLILDEVHERTMDLDLLFIALRKLKDRRANLKIILMSATVNAQKFSTYFDDAPVMDLPGRTFPVEVKYLEDAIEDTLDIQGKNLGTKTMLADEDESFMSDEPVQDKTSLTNLDGYSSKTKTKLNQMDEYRIDYDLIAKLATVIATDPKYIKYSTALLIFMPGIAEIRRLNSTLLSLPIFADRWIVHMLHSSFSTEDLEKAFAIPPRGFRKIVIATNIAETGITIPDVTAVIDTCKEKIMRFDERRQLSRLTEGFISRSSARQRKGRAARVQDGLCFHLVTKYRYENLMSEQNTPEMLRLSLQDPILRIKVWNLGSIEETLSAAIDPPTLKNIRRAVDKLKDAGALSATESLTPLGKQLSRLPMEIALGKLAVFGIIFKCLDAVVTMVAALSSKSPFIQDKGGRQGDPRLPFSRGESDLISTLNAYQGWKKAKVAGAAHTYCRKHQLSDQNLSQIEDQKVQLLVYLVDAGLLQLQPSERQSLNKARNAANRGVFFEIPPGYNSFEDDRMLCTIIAAAFYPRILVREGRGWRNVYTNQQVSLSSTSVNRASEKPPQWLSFHEAMQSKSGTLSVFETSRIPEIALAILVGHAEFKLFSGVINLDNGKARFSLRQWRHLVAMRDLREHLTKVVEQCWRTPGLSASSSDQLWIQAFANLVIGREMSARQSQGTDRSKGRD